MKQSIGFIGGGRITRIFLQAFQNKNARFSSVVVNDTNNEAASGLKKLFPHIRIDNGSVAAAQDIVLYLFILR
jgi:pyrroline-5-carboxylate reductase